MLIYVNNLLVCENNVISLQKFKKYLGRCFHKKDLGKFKHFLSIEVARGSPISWKTKKQHECCHSSA